MDIFVVENHPDTLKWLIRYLTDSGHVVRSAQNVRSALHALLEGPLDVLISDIGLPDGDGWELLGQARLSSDVYAIAMSGFGRAQDHAKSKAAGYRRHMLKPLDLDDLDGMLDEAAREKSLRLRGTLRRDQAALE